MAEEKAITLEEVGDALAVPEGTQAINGLIGLTTDDLSLPYTYLVRSGSKHAVLKDGKPADAGSYYHSARKTAEAELEVVIVRAEKGETERGGEGEDKEEMVPVWRTILLPTKNLSSPFSMSFKGMNLWHGFKPFLNMLMAEEITDLNGIVIKLASKMATTKSGNSYEVPEITVVRDASEEEKNAATELASRL